MADRYQTLDEEKEEEGSVDDSPAKSNPAEKVRVRMAAEAYNGLYNSMSGPEEPLHGHESKGKSNDKACTRAEKQLTILLVVCILVVVVMSAFLVLQRIQLDDLMQVCSSPDCIETSGAMMSQMDLSVDPCSDFYEYSCARGLQDPSFIPPDKSKWGLFSKLDKRNKAVIKKLMDETNGTYEGVNSSAVYKSKVYYDTCMNATIRENLGIDPMLQVIDNVGSWPLTDQHWNANDWDVEENLAMAHGYGVSPFFSIFVSTDDKNSNKQMICFDQGGTTFNDYNRYSGNESEKFHAAFVKYFRSVSQLLGAEESESAQAAEEVWQFETKISAIQTKPENRTDPWELYHLMTIGQLKQDFSGWLNLSRFVGVLFEEAIPDGEKVIVYAPDFLSNLTSIVNSVEKSVLANYLTWHMVLSLVPLMPLSFRLAMLDFEYAQSGVQSSPALWEECIERTTGTIGFAVGALFVKKSFSEDSKQNVQKILDGIRNAFEESLPETSWMDVNTRERALDKAKAIIDKIGYPDFIKQPAELDAYYEKLKFEGTSEFNNSLAARIFYVKKNLLKLKNETDRTEWAMSPEMVNAYYSPAMNEIVFPAGILQKPFYDANYPKSLVYGAIGMVMGHELTHGFDNSGRKYDKHGNLHDWWTNSSVTAFDKRTQCLVEEYSAFKVQSENLNGLTTLGENIADNGGIKSALKAYKTWKDESGVRDIKLPGLNMTSEQLFFLSFSQVWCSYYTPQYALQSLVTDPHSYAKFRVIGVLKNMPEFASAFQCAKGTPMNSGERCSVW